MSYPYSDQPLPFTADIGELGLQLAKGVVKTSTNGLILEFQTVDAIVGLIKSDVKQLQLPYDSIRAISFKKGLFSSKLTISCSSMKELEDVDFAEQATLTLKIKRKDRSVGKDIVGNMHLELSEHRLKKLEDE
jgi:hypothetical protein